MNEKYEQTISTYNQNAKTYYNLNKDSTANEDLKELNKYRELFLMYFQKNPKILDLGCGAGRDCEFFHKQKCNVVGIDLAEEFITLNKEHFPEIEFKKMDMLQLTFKENEFDGVWSCASLLHLEKTDIKQALQEAYRILKSEGVFYLSLKTTKKDKPKQLDNDKRFFEYYEEDEIIKILENIGFEIIFQKTELLNKNEWINLLIQK